MHLPNKYIKRIDDFLQRMDFEFHDIRFELVDHLASDIENHITDYDDFFAKNGMKGKFLLYMLSKKTELEEQYEKLKYKKLFSDLKSILKGVFKLLIKPQIAVSFLTVFFIFKKIAQTDIKTAVIGSTVLLILIILLQTIFFVYEYKKTGKLKVIHSYTVIIPFVFYFFANVPNVIEIFRLENQDINVVYIRFTGIVLSSLLFLDYLNKRNHFKEKYQYLLWN